MKPIVTLPLLWLCGLVIPAGAQHRQSVSLPRYRFQFEATQPITADDCYYNRVTVFNRRSGSVIQRIMLDAETAQSVGCRLPASALLMPVDANNDGHQDAMLLSLPAATNQVYDLWLFHPRTERFRRALAGLFNPDVNRQRREIRTTHQMGLGSSEQNLYRYGPNGFYRYEMTTREHDDQAGVTRVVVKRLVNGQLRIVRQFSVPDPR
jgi:hypothetical protein